MKINTNFQINNTSSKFNINFEKNNTKFKVMTLVKSFIDLASMAKGLIDKNQQPSVKQELKDCFLRKLTRFINSYILAF